MVLHIQINQAKRKLRLAIERSKDIQSPQYSASFL